MDELFAPPAYEWKRLSPNYRSLRRLTTLIFVPLIFVIPAILVWVLTGLWWVAAIILALAAIILVVRLALVGRTWRSWGYVEREDDLYITHGVLFRSLVAVPGSLERGASSSCRTSRRCSASCSAASSRDVAVMAFSVFESPSGSQ